ncbi:MAG: hypothetical protein EBU33_01580 [Sphingobacteriia bacterium]|nr:hypothetical protein [Sphingobacteriia bacterium]
MAQLVEFGLNKLERLRAEAFAKEPLPLNPNFPFITATVLPRSAGGGWMSPRGFDAQLFEAHISLPEK